MIRSSIVTKLATAIPMHALLSTTQALLYFNVQCGIMDSILGGGVESSDLQEGPRGFERMTAVEMKEGIEAMGKGDYI